MQTFVLFAIAGLVAQLVDGSLGMAYGVTSTTLLLTAGLAPAAASATVHLAEIGTTLMSGAAHWRFGNVDWRTIGWIAGPGALGAFLGALLLSSLPVEGSTPWIAGLLIALGLYVLLRFTRREPVRTARKVRSAFLVPLGLVAGAMDAVGGGGWGPIGTSTLLASGRLEPRKVVGSVDTAEFAVTIGGSAGFLVALSSADIHLLEAAALLAGGLVAAPLAAWLVRVLPTRILGAGAGGLIVLTNARTLLGAVGAPDPWPAVTYTVVIASWACALLVAVRLTRGRKAWPQPR
ncbi:MAG: sulfite exporter TauE/SafE family protein [Streptosporangiales bacterium]